MKLLISMPLAVAAAAPAWAHSGAHLHPHDGVNWLVVVSALTGLPAVVTYGLARRARAKS